MAVGDEGLRLGMVVGRLGLFDDQPGTPPDLVLLWSPAALSAPVVDLVLHLHGYDAHGVEMDIVRDKFPLSGLDPHAAVSAGRPWIGMIPRGRFFGGKSGHGYDFPILSRADALASLIDLSLEAFADTVERPLPILGRRILTAHSGGGAAAMPVAALFDPDEIHVFDGLYQDNPALIAWAQRAIAADEPGHPGRALRVLYRAGTGTEAPSRDVAQAVSEALAQHPTPDPKRAARFRVEAVSVEHHGVAQTYGPILLADGAAGLV